jgi:hypothetical protein
MRWGYFPKTGVSDEMALTDTEIKGQCEGKGLQPERQRRTVPLDYAAGWKAVALGIPV